MQYLPDTYAKRNLRVQPPHEIFSNACIVNQIFNSDIIHNLHCYAFMNILRSMKFLFLHVSFISHFLFQFCALLFKQTFYEIF